MKKHKGKILIAVLAIIVIVETIILLWNRNEGDVTIALNSFDTSVTTVAYREEAVKNVRVSYNKRNTTQVDFFADVSEKSDIVLFTIFFDSDQGTVLGKVEDKNGKMVKVSFDKKHMEQLTGVSESEIERLTKTQEDLLDAVLSNFVLEQTASEVVQEELEERCMIIDTPYTELIYPEQWEDYLEIEESKEEPYTIKFYCNLSEKGKKELFSYTFGDASDLLVGYWNDIEVGCSVGTEEVDESWSEEEIEIFYTMREDMSIIIDGLMNTEGFIAN